MDQQVDKHQTIALCMIVKDEEQVITRAFDSVRDLVDYYVICDTGSSDNTIQVIQEYWRKHNLKGEVRSRPWVNFAHNRTEAFNFGKGKADYIMTLDADEVFAPLVDGTVDLFKKITALPKFTKDRVEVKTHFGDVVYTRCQFYRDGLDWKWVSPIHEVCVAPDETYPAQVLKDACVYPTRDGARAKDPSRFLKDALTFERELIDAPEDARMWFYLAQSYCDASLPERAIEPFKKCIEISPWAEEKAVAALRLGRLYHTLEDFGKGLEWYWKSYAFSSDRVEAIYEILRYYRLNEMWELGVKIADLALKCTGENTLLFIEKPLYDWKVKDEAVQCYYNTYQFNRSKKTVQRDTEVSHHPRESAKKN